MRFSGSVLRAVVPCLLALAVGCGGGGTRRSVSGTVTRDGQPLASGAVTFLRGTPPSPAGGALVRKGAFALLGDQGLEPGTYLVAVSSPVQGEDERTPEEKAAGASMRAKESIPAKYNSSTTLSVEVSARGNNHFDLTLD